MKPINKYDKNSIMDESVFSEVFAQEDPFYRSQMLAALQMRAKELRIKGEFEKAYKGYEEREKRRRQREVSTLEHWTNFSGGGYDRMKCGQWIATDDGIRLYNPDNGMQDIVACRHPIMPIRRMRSLQTDEEQITVAFKRNGAWRELTVPKTTITQASKICGLAAKSVLVTSESANLLVRYLADVEADNEEDIPLVLSSSKMGWVKGTFLPYDKEILFDGGTRFRPAYESIRAHGSRDMWYSHIKSLRALGRFELNFMLAAAFASVLLSVTGGLPFIIDLWGESGSGKTVALMVAASVWADPGKGMYIRDYASTDVGLEALADFLNHLPVILDDTSKKNQMVEKRFEEIVYNLCSGKGRTRSNKDLGINRESTWENIVLTNGEKPITSYVTQGGALNRVLEVESQMDIFPDPQKTVDIVKANYGYAGMDFVEAVKKIGFVEIRQMQRSFQKDIMLDEKAQKQSISLSIVMTADKIATDYLFRDGQYINLEEAKKILIAQSELSDNERCYQYIMDKVAMNASRFDLTANIEKWGTIETGYVIFYNQALEELCKQGGFSKKVFVSWAKKNGLIQVDSKGNAAKQKWLEGKNQRCIFLKISGGEEKDAGGIAEDKDGFLSPEDYGQGELPFD